MQYFYAACDEELPEKDENFDAEGTGAAKDTINQWREQKLGLQKEEGGVCLPCIPTQLRHNLDIRFEPRASAKTLNLREINASHVGSLVQLDCVVLRVSQVK